MKIACYGDSLTEGLPGVSYIELLRKVLPEQTIINYGKGGDTVRSLYHRIESQKLFGPTELVFVWIGVNDAFVHVAWHFPLIKQFLRQFWGRTPEECSEYYAKILQKSS